MKQKYLMILLVIFSALLFGQEQKQNPLEPFEKLIGGKWYAEGHYQTFDWGVGNLSVNSKGYFIREKGDKLASEGAWYFHPGENRIKGYFTAIEMPVELFDYTTTVIGDTIKSDLTAYSSAGKASQFYEEFIFTGENEYQWTLYIIMNNTKSKMMEGTYTRKYSGEIE